MTDRDKVYTKVKKTIKQMLKLDHQGQVVTLAMMITGIAMSRKAQLSMMSAEVPGKSKDQSIEMRMRRWEDRQSAYDLSISSYLAGSISLGHTAELIDLPLLDLQARFIRLGVPLNLGA